MIPVQIALVGIECNVPIADIGFVAGALNEQLQADFVPAWSGFHAHVLPYSVLEPDPGTWQVRLMERIDQPGALGYHTDEHHQPYAVVDTSSGDDWTVTASHEILEMLADPWGARMHSVRSWASWRAFSGSDSQRVRMLVEVCDPCEAFSYRVGGVAVSDFVLPSWYRSARTAQFTDRLGELDRPVQVRPGGYVSFMDPATQEWYQLFVYGVGDFKYRHLGKFDRARYGTTIREWTDRWARAQRSAE